MSKTEEESIFRRTSFGPTFYSQQLYQSRSKRNLVKPAVFQSSTPRLTFLLLSDSPDLVDLAFLEAFTYRNSSTARAPPPPTHQLDLPWLSFEPSFCFWWLETLGPSEPAFSPVKTTTTNGKAHRIPASTPHLVLPSTMTPASTPASRHASTISCSAKAKLGFPLEGLAFKTGPSTSSRPKPIICAPIINETKPRSVKSSLFLLSISNQCLGRCLILKCRRHHLRQNSPSLLLVFNHTLRTLGLASNMAMSVDYRFILEKRTISEEESIQEASPSEEDWKKTKVDSKKIFAQPHQSARQGADPESIPPDLQTGISRCTTAQKQQPQAMNRVIAAPWILWPIWSSRTSAEDNWNNAQFEIKNATFQQQAVPSNRTRQGTAYADQPPETLICQTEAAWLDQSKNAGLGWVVLNSNREVKAKICKPVSFVKGTSEAEAMCIYEALLSLQSQQDNKSIIESDAKNVITATVSRKPLINLTGTIEDILTVAKSCRALSFSFTPRSENLLVDDLAKTAVRSMTIGLLLRCNPLFSF